MRNRNEYERVDDVSQSQASYNDNIDLLAIGNEFARDESSVTKAILENNNEQSTYAVVANNISNTDDPTIACVTVRAVLIGIFLTCIMSFTAEFFALRTSPLDVNLGLVILLSYMMGELVHRICPEKLFRFTINPGPLTMKEHALIAIMASSVGYTSMAVEGLILQRLYYQFFMNHVTGMAYLLSMQIFALSLSGILNRYLIWPPSMLWPKSIMGCALIRTLVTGKDGATNDKSSWKLSRVKFFWLVVFLEFIYYWFPGYIFPLLSMFSVFCLFAPHNIVWSQITGAFGLGIGAFEFDWNSWVAYLDSPILVPFWAHVNIFVGFIVCIWIVTPIVYYTNTWNSELLPIISVRAFNERGNFYQPKQILTKDLILNKTAYAIYGKVELSAGYAVSYGFLFAALTALIVHTILYHGRSIVDQFRLDLSHEKSDIHSKLISYYPQVPAWCYAIVLLLSVLIAVLVCHFTHVTPAYGLLVAILVSIIFALPNSIITAMTNMSWTSTAPGDLIPSLILPGQPLSYITFRIYTYVCQSHILLFLSNYKIGHYMKISPRVVFFAIALSTFIGTLIQYITAILLIDIVPNICTEKNPQWQCLNLQSAYTSSIVFGAIGAFTNGGKYSVLLYGFLIGGVLPVLTWCLCKLFPKITWLTLINTPIFLMATNNIPPAPAAEFVSWFLAGFFFNFVLYRYAHGWWQKYAYIFSAAMSCGVAIAGIAIFFILQLNGIDFPSWWGMGGVTADGCPLENANYSGYVAH